MQLTYSSTQDCSHTVLYYIIMKSVTLYEDATSHVPYYCVTVMPAVCQLQSSDGGLSSHHSTHEP